MLRKTSLNTSLLMSVFLVAMVCSITAGETIYVDVDANQVEYAGPLWSFTTVGEEAQPDYPEDGAVIPGHVGDPWYPDIIYTEMKFIKGATAVKHTGYFSKNREEVANRVEDANLGPPPYSDPRSAFYDEETYYAGIPLDYWEMVRDYYDPYVIIPTAGFESLERGQVYYWTVDETDAEGNVYSGDVWEFTIQCFKPCAPSPPNEATDVETDVLLCWCGSGAQEYDVYIGTDWNDVNDAPFPDPIFPPFPPFLGTTSETCIQVSGLAFDTKYYWRVDEVKGRFPPSVGTIYRGDVWCFTTVGVEAQPEYPEDGDVITGMPYTPEPSILYTELIFIPGATAVKHTGYLSTNRDEVANRVEDANLGPPPYSDPRSNCYNDVTYYAGLPLDFWDPMFDICFFVIIPTAGLESLERGQVYYWTVDETDAEGNTFSGDIWEFTVQDYKASLPNPPNEATDVETDVLLSWLEGYGAQYHDIFIGTNWEDVNNAYFSFHPPSSPEYVDTTDSGVLSYQMNGLDPGTRYYWRVDAVQGRFPPSVGTIYKGDVWCFTTVPHPHRIFVDIDAAGANNGTSWENAYNYLQDALADANSAVKPVEIRVAKGIYKPDRSTADPNGSGEREATFHLINGVTLKGGYAGFGEPVPNARDIEAYETILSGDLAGNDADVNEARELLDDPCRAENSYHVVYSYQNDVNAVLDGFAIHSGSGSPGGGIYNYCSSPTIANCTFTRNTGHSGGGIYNYGFISYGSGDKPPLAYLGKPVLTNCRFIMNAAERSGGGMFNCCRAEPTVTNCVFIDNWAEDYGGGMYNGDCNSIITNCMFIGNSTFHYGGGMSNKSSNPIVKLPSNPVVTGCTFRKNRAQYGGGMDNRENSSPIVTNCLFVENEAFEDSAGMFSRDSSPRLINCTFSCNWSHGPGGHAIFGDHSYTLINCIVWGDRLGLFGREVGGPAVVTYSNIQDGWLGEGNIDADPCFVEPGHWEDPCNTPGDYMDDIWVEGDYHLKSQAGRWEPNSKSWVLDDDTSPCIDAGNPGCPLGDEPEPNGNRRNMGTYGGTAEASKSPAYWRSIADITNDWRVDFNDLKIFADYWLETGECIPGDLNRNKFSDFADFALMALHWQEDNNPKRYCVVEDDVRYCIRTDKSVYHLGETVEILYRITNLGSVPVSLGWVPMPPFCYHFVIVDNNGEHVWLWSWVMPPSPPVEFILDTYESKEYEIGWDMINDNGTYATEDDFPIGPGMYKITCELLSGSEEDRVKVSVNISVRE